MERLELTDVRDALRARDRYLILTHKRCDGDTLGSAAALCRALRACGKTAFLAPNEDVTPRLAFLVEGLTAPADYAPATVVAVDIADEGLLPPSMARFAGKCDLLLDHHPSNRQYARAGLVRASACAVGEIVFQVLELLNVPFDRAIWAALYTAVSTDTGCFKFSNTTPLAHQIAAGAIANGIDFLHINRAFFEKKTRARLTLEGALYGGLRYSADGLVCGTVLTRALIDGAHADYDDLDNLSTLTMALENVLVGVVLTGNADGTFKASVRSHRPVDAAAICGRFGGGGHPRASGCTLTGDGDAALAALMRAAEEQVARSDLSLADV